MASARKRSKTGKSQTVARRSHCWRHANAIDDVNRLLGLMGIFFFWTSFFSSSSRHGSSSKTSSHLPKANVRKTLLYSRYKSIKEKEEEKKKKELRHLVHRSIMIRLRCVQKKKKAAIYEKKKKITKQQLPVFFSREREKCRCWL